MFLDGEPYRQRGSSDEPGALCAGPGAPFLSATVEHGPYRLAIARYQNPGPSKPTGFMTGKGDACADLDGRPQSHASEALRGICVHRHAQLVGELSGFLDGLQRPYLVLPMNEANQAYRLVRGHNLGCSAAIDIPENPASLGASIEHRGVFGGCEQDWKLLITRALDGEIVGFGSPGQENHSFRIQIERPPYLLPSLLDDGPSLTSCAVQTVRIRMMAFLDEEESFEYAWIDEGARIVIEVITQGTASTS